MPTLPSTNWSKNYSSRRPVPFGPAADLVLLIEGWEARVYALVDCRRPTMESHSLIRFATADDTKTISHLIRELAEYERLLHEVVLDEDQLRENLFGPRPFAEVLLAEADGEVFGFTLFFHNFSTFLGRPGIYLE